jgi:hypothetical protein
VCKRGRDDAYRKKALWQLRDLHTCRTRAADIAARDRSVSIGSEPPSPRWRADSFPTSYPAPTAGDLAASRVRSAEGGGRERAATVSTVSTVSTPRRFS